MGRSVVLEMLHSNVSRTAAHRGRRCLWFYNIGIKLTRSGQSEDKYEQIVTVKLAAEFVPGRRTGLGFWALNRGRSPLFITLVRPWSGVGLHRLGPGLHVPGCSQVSKIGRPPWNPTLFPSVPPSLPSILTRRTSPLPAPGPPLQICCTAAVTLHCHNHNLFPAAGLLGTCILQAGGARLCLRLMFYRVYHKLVAPRCLMTSVIGWFLFWLY